MITKFKIFENFEVEIKKGSLIYFNNRFYFVVSFTEMAYNVIEFAILYNRAIFTISKSVLPRSIILDFYDESDITLLYEDFEEQTNKEELLKKLSDLGIDLYSTPSYKKYQLNKDLDKFNI